METMNIEPEEEEIEPGKSEQPEDLSGFEFDWEAEIEAYGDQDDDPELLELVELELREKKENALKLRRVEIARSIIATLLSFAIVGLILIFTNLLSSPIYFGSFLRTQTPDLRTQTPELIPQTGGDIEVLQTQVSRIEQILASNPDSIEIAILSNDLKTLDEIIDVRLEAQETKITDAKEDSKSVKEDLRFTTNMILAVGGVMVTIVLAVAGVLATQVYQSRRKS